MLCGAIGGCIIGFIVRLLIGPLPAPWQEFAACSGGGLVALAILGFVFPKPVMLVSAPFIKMLEGV